MNMVQNKILTLIIPTYNMEKFLRKCLDSLIVSDENMQRLEVLVVNDGSKDSSSAIAHEYQEKYPQTYRVIDKENGNYGSCINRGLKEVKGKYVKVLDADDYFEKTEFNSFIVFLSSVDVDMVISNYCMVDIEGKIKESYSFPFVSSRNILIDEMPESAINRLWHHGVAYKTDILREMNYRQTEGISYTDDEWIFKPMIFVKSIRYFPHNLYLYLRGREGQTFDPKVKEREFKSRLIVAKSLSDFLEEWHCKISDNNLRYLQVKFVSRIRNIYSYYILQTNLTSDMEVLRNYDLYLKNSSRYVYTLTDEIHNKFGFYYIRKWRQSNYNERCFSISFHRGLYRFIKLIAGGILDSGI